MERQAIRAPTLFTLLAGLLLTAIAWAWVSHEIDTRARIQFNRYVDRLQDEISQRLRLTRHGLMGARDLYLGSEHVYREDMDHLYW